jgi:hypothetical protein
VKAYIKKIMSQLNKWMMGGKISKLVVVVTDKESGEHVERWQFDVRDAVRGTSTKTNRNHFRFKYSGNTARVRRPRHPVIRKTPALSMSPLNHNTEVSG